MKLPHNLNPKNAVSQKAPENENPTSPRSSTWSSLKIKGKRGKAYDKPAYDPRTQTAPYFLHSPVLWFHHPPYTLRYGGTQDAPVAALMHVAAGWRNWKLEFGEELSKEGVVDGRGVVGLEYGTRNGENGTLKGYGVRSFRYPGESGKTWFRQRKAAGGLLIESPNKVKPEEVVELRWIAPLSIRTREYRFTWRGFQFVWKDHDFERPGSTAEETLAFYTSVNAARKAGRLQINLDVIHNFVNEHMAELEMANPSVQQHSTDLLEAKAPLTAGSDRIHQRLKDIIMATALSMIIQEFQKRQTIWVILITAAQAYGG